MASAKCFGWLGGNVARIRGGILGASLRLLGTSWGRLGCFLRACWGLLGAILEAFGEVLWGFWNRNWRRTSSWTVFVFREGRLGDVLGSFFVFGVRFEINFEAF